MCEIQRENDLDVNQNILLFIDIFGHSCDLSQRFPFISFSKKRDIFSPYSFYCLLKIDVVWNLFSELVTALKNMWVLKEVVK